jgi:hypothetical protein
MPSKIILELWVKVLLKKKLGEITSSPHELLGIGHLPP